MKSRVRKKREGENMGWDNWIIFTYAKRSRICMPAPVHWEAGCRRDRCQGDEGPMPDCTWDAIGSVSAQVIAE